jgi:hypothetical protein
MVKSPERVALKGKAALTLSPVSVGVGNVPVASRIRHACFGGGLPESQDNNVALTVLCIFARQQKGGLAWMV